MPTPKADVCGSDLASTLREAIARRSLVPRQRLVEADLSQLYGGSRSAVRAALAELTWDGLMLRVAHSGVRVRAISKEEAIAILEVRQVLEPLCAGKAAVLATRGAVAGLEEVRAALECAAAGDDAAAYASASRRLHVSISELSGMAPASALVDRLWLQTALAACDDPGLDGLHWRQSLPRYVRVVDAIADGDASTAEASMRLHLGAVRHR